MEDQKKITVFGATGKVGKELLTFLSNAHIATIAVTRDRNKGKQMPFVEWIEADMANRETLFDTMRNSYAVFLSSSVNENFVIEQSNVISIAQEIGIEHLVKLSTIGASKDSPFFIAKLNFQVEEILKATSLGYTILQPNAFMQNWLGEFSNTIKKEHKIFEATEDGKKPFIDTRDIAEVAFTILRHPSEHKKKTYLLTADEAVSYEQVANAISATIGTKVDYIRLTIEELQQKMIKRNMPSYLIQTFSAIAEGQRNGKSAHVNSVVKDILGKPSRTIYNFVNDYIAWFE